MLGRKNFTQDEIDRAKSAVARQLRTYEAVFAAEGATVGAERKAFETLYSNNMTLVLDRYFVHRLRIVTGKDSNPLNEIELIADSLMNNGGVMCGNNVIKYVAQNSVAKVDIGDPIALTKSDFERLSAAFFADLERKFL